MKKYKLTKKSIKFCGKTLFQIKALKTSKYVEKGSLGGYIEKEGNLSQEGDAWVYGNAWVSGNARVSGNACVSGNAKFKFDWQIKLWQKLEKKFEEKVKKKLKSGGEK